MARRIDLNSDLGESFGPWDMGDDAAMLSIVSSANIACGGHASDPETMYKTLVLARENGVTVGAHPGYNDREGFGRRIIPMPPEEIGHMVAAQIGALQALATMADTKVSYVKPHGALGNLAAADAQVAKAVVAATQSIDAELAILAISGGQLDVVGRAMGCQVFSEIFADRGYLSNGQLVPRGQDGAMIHDPAQASDRLLEYLETGRMPVIDGAPIALNAHSICVHGDSSGAVDMARVIRENLTKADVVVTGFMSA